MSKQKQDKRLGRGLESLLSRNALDSRLGTDLPTAQVGAARVGARPGVDALMVRIDALQPNPLQPRRGVAAEEVAGLAESLRQSGMLQPIVVRRAGTRLEIVAGERRWRAARVAGFELVPVLIRQASDKQMLEMALVENIQRTDLNAIEKAGAYRRLCEEFSLSAEQVGRLVGEDRTTVTNYLRLLELPREVMEMVSGDEISMGHARCLLGIDRVERQVQLARSVCANALSVRALEEIVRRTKFEEGEAVTAQGRGRVKAAHVVDLEGRFEAALGLKVSIRESRRKGRGRIIIEYNSLDDFDRVAAALGVGRE